MEQLVCPTCGDISQSSAKYCQYCGQQLRCMQCGTLLSREARVCPECGSRVLERADSVERSRANDVVLPGYNRLKIDQTRDEYHLDYIFSNEAAAEQQGLISKLAASRAISIDEETDSTTASKDTSFGQLQSAVIAPQLPGANPQSVPPANPEDSSDSDSIWKVLGNAQGKVEQIELDLKCDTQKDYVTRLVRLFLYAHQQLGHVTVAADDIQELLDRISINRKSQTVYLSGDKQGLQKDGDSYKLSLVGARAIPAYLVEIMDPGKAGRFIPGEQKKPQGPKQRTRTKGGDDPNSWALATRHLSEQVPHPKANALENNEKVLLGLYGVRLARGIQFETTASHLVDYLYRAFEISLTRDQARYSMDKLTGNADGLAIKGKTGSVKITSSGCTHIESVLGLTEPDLASERSEHEGDAD